MTIENCHVTIVFCLEMKKKRIAIRTFLLVKECTRSIDFNRFKIYYQTMFEDRTFSTPESRCNIE